MNALRVQKVCWFDVNEESALMKQFHIFYTFVMAFIQGFLRQWHSLMTFSAMHYIAIVISCIILL